MRINHGDLQRVDDSSFKVKCPKCEAGILRMRRNFVTLRLLNWDICPSCKEKIIFDDIKDLIEREANSAKKK